MSGSPNPVVESIPHARRYARALVAVADEGDRLVERALSNVMDAGSGASFPGHRLYTSISRLHRDAAQGPREDTLRRQVLLLRALEDLDNGQTAAVVGLEEDVTQRLFNEAMADARRLVSADALIIEDEPVTALEIERLMTECGHRVIGVAANEEKALALAANSPPGLILADVKLGAGGSGRAAVARILEGAPAPVIFVTAYPEHLLTGQHPEPAFVLGKPFDPTALAAASFQAVSAGKKPF
ncbi:response regulator [Elioraea rosea]|uniref:response regulator n=1 Tax=Elioraea rosea TaxID=2492390 RepID=UPI0011862D4A|nr:response regulator [Elioraea rosea]